MTLLTYNTFTFQDPLWGPVSFRMYVYRHDGEDLPRYEVVVE